MGIGTELALTLTRLDFDFMANIYVDVDNFNKIF